MTQALANLSRLVLVVPVLLGLLAGGAGMMALAPEPDPVPRRWQFDAQFGDLKITQVAGKSYLILTYKVTNNSGQDLLFAPSFEMVGSEDTAIRRSGRGVPADVTASLLRSLNDPLLEDQIGIIGMLQRGPENARQGLVVWPVENTRPGKITIFASGFSGETAIVIPPGSGADKGVTLRKTMMREYADIGDLSLKTDGPLPMNDARWIMR